MEGRVTGGVFSESLVSQPKNPVPRGATAKGPFERTAGSSRINDNLIGQSNVTYAYLFLPRKTERRRTQTCVTYKGSWLRAVSSSLRFVVYQNSSYSAGHV